MYLMIWSNWMLQRHMHVELLLSTEFDDSADVVPCKCGEKSYNGYVHPCKFSERSYNGYDSCSVHKPKKYSFISVGMTLHVNARNVKACFDINSLLSGVVIHEDALIL
ncbi:hypothetical protein ACLB2K_061613 [Fragaria x ananassa]